MRDRLQGRSGVDANLFEGLEKTLTSEGEKLMTINVSINGNKLFEWEGNAELAGRLDEDVRELARENGITPE